MHLSFSSRPLLPRMIFPRSKGKRGGFFLAFSLFTLFALHAEELPLSAFVNPFIGTAPNTFVKVGSAFDTGNVFPGAVFPRGLLAWSPDTTNKDHIAGGYWYPDPKILGFSLTHFSGRGVVCLKDITFLPINQEVTTSPEKDLKSWGASFSHTNESAHPGYYQVKFDNGIQTELTATPRTGMARFAFPTGQPAALLIRTDSSVSVGEAEVTGWHTANKYTVYFVAQFDHPFSSAKTWSDDALNKDLSATGKTCGAILNFNPATASTVQVRVGISYVSLENARANLTQENTAWDFAAIHLAIEKAWNHVLNRIQVEGGTPEEKQVFYTALYHCFMHPNILEDANGQYLGFDKKVHSVTPGHHQYQNIPAWDEHRSHTPLIALLVPNETSDIMQSLVNYAQQDAEIHPSGGGLPRWEQVGYNSGGMVGDGDDSIIASAYAFGATSFDLKGALAAMDKGASIPDTTSDGHRVREGLTDYQTIGYVPEHAAATLEYCNDDFALAEFAQALGDHEKYLKYHNRAQNWKNLFDPETGYLRPKKADGSWFGEFSLKSTKGYVEGSTAQYFWLVNFNFRGLADKAGGNDKTIERLDKFFLKTNGGLSSESAYMGNEPCEEAPWVYDFVSAPWRTQEVVRRIQTELFTNQPNGFPGNDDAGSISSWYVFSALGLYPEIPGMAGFVVGSPVFPKATIHRDDGLTIQIIGNNAAHDNPYVQALEVNSQPYNSPWIPWSLLAKGGTVTFHLGNKPSTWGKDLNQAPPSFDTIQ